ncbi:MAG: hypothetical protein ACE5EH_10420, partial [Gammaproteobacteria bacterium]
TRYTAIFQFLQTPDSVITRFVNEQVLLPERVGKAKHLECIGNDSKSCSLYTSILSVVRQ